MTVAGQPVDPKNTLTATCQRTGDGLTVHVQASGDWAQGAEGQARMVAFTDDAWSAVGGK